MGQPRCPQGFDLGGGHEGFVTRGHGRRQPPAVGSQLVYKATGERPPEGVDPDLEPEAGRQVCIPPLQLHRFTKGQADASDAPEVGVPGEVIGTGGRGRRRRVEQGADGNTITGGRGQRRSPKGQTHPDRGRLGRQARDRDRGQQDAGTALPRAGDIDHDGLHAADAP